MTGAAIFAAAAAWFLYLERYRKTSHGPNPWTLEAFANVHMFGAWFDSAAKMVKASMTSCYRSPEVNAAVGGVPTSLHQRGLAVDLVPVSGDLVSGARVLELAARAGELGPVREVGVHKGHVHVGWFGPGESGTLKTWGFA